MGNIYTTNKVAQTPEDSSNTIQVSEKTDSSKITDENSFIERDYIFLVSHDTESSKYFSYSFEDCMEHISKIKEDIYSREGIITSGNLTTISKYERFYKDQFSFESIEDWKKAVSEDMDNGEGASFIFGNDNSPSGRLVYSLEFTTRIKDSFMRYDTTIKCVKIYLVSKLNTSIKISDIKNKLTNGLVSSPLDTPILGTPQNTPISPDFLPNNVCSMEGVCESFSLNENNSTESSSVESNTSSIEHNSVESEKEKTD
jgi:hypothetical protein